MQDDFDDVRFATDDGIVLDYWKETYTASGSATIWVNLPAGATSIWMYYGNAAATDIGSRSNTYILYDDFNGPSLDTTTWTDTTPGRHYFSNGWICDTQVLGAGFLITNNQLVSGPTIVEMHIHVDSLPSSSAYCCGDFPVFHAPLNGLDWHREPYRYVYIGGGGSGWRPGTSRGLVPGGDYYNTWIITPNYQVHTVSGSASYTDLFPGSTLIDTHSSMMSILGGSNSVPGRAIRMDWIRVRKYVESEPTFTYGTSQTQYDVTTIAVTPSETNLIIDETCQFTATAYDAFGNVVPDIGFTWASSNETIGTVTENGVFLARYDGVSAVSASVNTVSGAALVTVTRVVTQGSSWNWSVDGWEGWSHTASWTSPAGACAEYGPMMADGHGEHGAAVILSAGSVIASVEHEFFDPTGVGWDSLDLVGRVGGSSYPSGRWMSIEVNGEVVYSESGFSSSDPDNVNPKLFHAEFPQTDRVRVKISHGQNPAWGTYFTMDYHSLTLLSPDLITMSSPLDDTVSAGGNVTVAGSVYDTAIDNLTLTHNGVNSTIPVQDGNFSTLVNLTAANTITISGVTSGGHPFSKTILLDGDMLPAEFEESIGFDPLNADSDCLNTTTQNEAGNGIIDGYEIFDGKLPVFAKCRIGANPFAVDTDEDGLTDAFELMHLGLTTSVCSVDSDGNGISDADEDPDSDGLSNSWEQNYNTSPLKVDTDDDLLPDPEEISLGTDPCNDDVDGDLLKDGHEVNIGIVLANPLVYDTNGNGIPDGAENYWSSKRFIDNTLNLTVFGRGYAIGNVSVAEVNFTNLMREDVLVSKVYDIRFGDGVDYGTAVLKYNSTFVENNQTLSVYRFDEDLGTFLPITSTVDETQGTVTCSVTNSSKYAVLDSVKWDALFVNWPGCSAGEISALGEGWEVVANGGFSQGQSGWAPSGRYIYNRSHYGKIVEIYNQFVSSPASLKVSVWSKGSGSDPDSGCMVRHPNVDLTHVDYISFYYKRFQGYNDGGISSSGLRFWIDGISTEHSSSFQDVNIYGISPPEDIWRQATIDVGNVEGVRTLNFKFFMNRISSSSEESYMTYLIDDVTATSLVEPRSPDTACVRIRAVDSQTGMGVPNAEITLSDGRHEYTDLYGYASDFLIKSTTPIAYTITQLDYKTHDGYIRVRPADFGTERTDYAIINDYYAPTGSIDVTYNVPSTFVYVDNMFYPGPGTGVQIHDLYAGEGNQHTVRVEKEGYVTQTQTVTVSESNPESNPTIVPFNLLTTAGAIEVTSSPGASVYLDFMYKCTTSAGSGVLTISNVNTGQHRLDVQKDGYAPFWTMVTVTEGQTTQITAELDNTDEDQDDLPDYYEHNGFIDGLGNWRTTDTDSLDTDGDGLSDGYEAGESVTVNGKIYFRHKSDPTKIDSDEDGIKDPDEYEFLTQLMRSDTDFDLLGDGFELCVGTEPTNPDTDYDRNEDGEEIAVEMLYGYTNAALIYDDQTYFEQAIAIADGFAFGEAGVDRCDNLYYLIGWMLSGVFVEGDFRDLGVSVLRGDGPAMVANSLALIPGKGDVDKALTKATKFVEKHPNKYFEVAHIVVNHIDPSIGSVEKYFGREAIDGLRAKGFSDNVIVSLTKQGINLKVLDEALESAVVNGQNVYARYPGLSNFFSQQLTPEGAMLKTRVTFNNLKITSSRKAGKPITSFTGNLQGAYSELCAKQDIPGTVVRDLSHINAGGVDYAVMSGNTLKIVEVKARQSLERADLKNYIKLDQQGNPVSFNANYAILSLGEDYFKNPNIQKEFVLYINSPESTAIRNHLNLDPDLILPYVFKAKDGSGWHSGTVKITVTAVNK